MLIDEAFCMPELDVVALLLEHPELMQRPIIESSSRAAIGRPPEDVVASFLG